MNPSGYHQATLSRMCAVGQTLRAQVYLQSYRIENAAWVREGVTPLDRANMLAIARDASGEAYSEAFALWQAHYSSCTMCQEAMKG